VAPEGELVKVVEKASNTPCPMSSSLDVWKIKIRALWRIRD
jgi:hypothetical protein